MNKGLLIVTMTTAAALCGCQSSKVKISGRLVGDNTQKVYLEQVTPLSQTIVDSTDLDKQGLYRFELKSVSRNPSLYNVIFGGERIPLLLIGGDRLTLNSLGSVARNYTVEGSEQSALLRSFYQPFVTGAQRLDQIAGRAADPTMDDQARRALIKEYTDEYYRIRREQLRFIIENKSSLAAVYALYQRLPGDANLSTEQNDVIYFRTVAEALEKSYPQSTYLAALHGEIARMESRANLSAQITESSYPDLALNDIYGKRVNLSSLAGKVILLDFWSAELGNSNVNNAEIKQLHSRFKGAATPFEVYQVAIDTSKSKWISTVQEQALPWVSVSDLNGRASSSLGLYNIQKLPANFLIDRHGDIVAKNIYGDQLEKRLEELTK